MSIFDTKEFECAKLDKVRKLNNFERFIKFNYNKKRG